MFPNSEVLSRVIFDSLGFRISVAFFAHRENIVRAGRICDRALPQGRPCLLLGWLRAEVDGYNRGTERFLGCWILVSVVTAFTWSCARCFSRD